MYDDQRIFAIRKKEPISYKTKKGICAILGFCIACVVTGFLFQSRMRVVDEKSEELQRGIAKEVFRLHILANSDTQADQAVKLKVRDAVIAYMERAMEADGNQSDQQDGDQRDGGRQEGAPTMDRRASRRWAQSQLKEIESAANTVLRAEKMQYAAKAEVTTCRFPEKQYGDMTFPKGDYEALRIRLGTAKGHNWWCVLYPGLCFLDTTCAVVSDEGKEELRRTLTEEEYDLILDGKNLRIKWFLFGD